MIQQWNQSVVLTKLFNYTTSCLIKNTVKLCFLWYIYQVTEQAQVVHLVVSDTPTHTTSHTTFYTFGVYCTDLTEGTEALKSHNDFQYSNTALYLMTHLLIKILLSKFR